MNPILGVSTPFFLVFKTLGMRGNNLTKFDKDIGENSSKQNLTYFLYIDRKRIGYHYKLKKMR